MSSNNEDINLKPNLYSFLLVWNSWLIGTLILTVVLFVMSLFSYVFIGFFIFSLIVLLISFAFVYIAYKKEKYTITGSKIIYSFWTLFSDNSVEININKITQVILHLWFIENKLFKTGKLIIQTAWSSSSKVKLKSINNPKALYEEIQNRMQNNWFRLKKENLVQSEKPHIIWVLWESVKWVLFNVIIVFYFLLWAFSSDEKGDVDYENAITQVSNTDTKILFIIALLVITGVVLMFIFRYLDIKKRVYEIYDDSIFYSEWFLSKNYSFLPMESISDAENKQSFFSKIFWIHDLIISSEWSSGQVYFYNMVNGRKMMDTIKYLKQNINNLHTNDEKIDNWEVVLEVSDNNELVEIKEEKSNKKYNEDFIANYQPDLKKTILVNIIYLFPIITIPIFIIQLIVAKFTTYSVWKNSIDYKYEFLNTKYYSFSVDKITQVNFYESILDRMIWTCSIEFFSIWSNKSLKYKNIKKFDWMEEKILSKVWIYKDEKVAVDIHFNLKEWLKSSLYWVILSLFVLIWIIIMNIFSINLLVETKDILIILSIIVTFFTFLLLLIIYTYKKFFYSQKWYSQNVYKDFVESISWIIIKTKMYANLDNIKAVECKKYPFTKTWNIILNVSWETKIEFWEKQKYYSISANGIKMQFASNCFDIVDEFDIMLNKWEIDKSEIMKEKQNLGNVMIFVILIMIIFTLIVWFPILQAYPLSIIWFIIFYWIIISLIIWYIKSKIYILQNSRFLNYFWIIYKHKKSVLFQKIDFIEKNQWFVHKIFWNGNISIFTKWSWSSDAKIIDITKFKEFYDLIKTKIK